MKKPSKPRKPKKPTKPTKRIKLPNERELFVDTINLDLLERLAVEFGTSVKNVWIYMDTEYSWDGSDRTHLVAHTDTPGTTINTRYDKDMKNYQKRLATYEKKEKEYKEKMKEYKEKMKLYEDELTKEKIKEYKKIEKELREKGLIDDYLKEIQER